MPSWRRCVGSGIVRELSLFSGAGGGLLGTHLLGWRLVGYVEWDDYCQRVLRARIDDGYLPVAPIFTDVREFIQSGAAAEYRGFADVVTGGFPCQPFSTAGKRAGADDPRNMWPATIDIIRVVRPRFAFLENVPGLLSSGYFGTILGDLAESGYDARWRVLSAAELGAPHKRDRLWIVATDSAQSGRGTRWTRGSTASDTGQSEQPLYAAADASGEGRMAQRGQHHDPEAAGRGRNGYAGGGRSDGGFYADTKADGAVVPDASGPIEGWGQHPQRESARQDSKFAGDGTQGAVADAARDGQSAAGTGTERAGWGVADGGSANVSDADGERQQEQRGAVADGAQYAEPERGSWWATEPTVGGMAHGLAAGMDGVAADAEGNLARVARGVPDRVNRLKALGNGQVPAVVAAAWRLLTEGCDAR